MNSREQIKELKGQIQYYESLTTFLNKKIEQQAQELLKRAKDKSQLSVLRKKNKALEDENLRLDALLALIEDDKGRGDNIIDVTRQNMQRQIAGLKRKQLDLENELFRKVEKISALEYELNQTKAFTVNLPPYGEIPKEFYDYVQDLKQQLQRAESNASFLSYQYDLLKKYFDDHNQHEQAEEYLNNYFRKRRGARQKISDEKIETIRKLREGGVSIRDIAEATGVSVGSVHRYLKTT